MRARCLPLIALLVAAPRAQAQRGVEAPIVRPTVDGRGLFSVESAQTAARWDVGLGIWTDYTYAPLRLDLKQGNASARRTTVISDEVTVRLAAHLGLADWLEVAVETPVSAERFTAAYGSVDDPLHPTGFLATSRSSNVPPPDASPLDARIALKARTPRFGRVGFAALVAVTVPFGDDSAFLGDSGFTFRPTVIVDAVLGRWMIAANASAILRQKTVVLDPADVVGHVAQPATVIEVGHELTASLGARVRIVRPLALAAEVVGWIPLDVDVQPSGRMPTPPDYVVDALAGVQIFPGRGVVLGVGGGSGLLDSRRQSYQSPRAFLSLAWWPGDAGSAAR